MKTEYGRIYQVNTRTGLPMWWAYGPLVRITSNRLGSEVREYVGNSAFNETPSTIGDARADRFLLMQPEEVQREFGDSNRGAA